MHTDFTAVSERHSSGRVRRTPVAVALRRLLTQIDAAEAIRRRAVQQAIAEVLPEYWLRRSKDFAAVGTPECDLIAENCRNHALLLAGEYGELVEGPWLGFDEDLDLVLVEREMAA